MDNSLRQRLSNLENRSFWILASSSGGGFFLFFFFFGAWVFRVVNSFSLVSGITAPLLLTIVGFVSSNSIDARIKRVREMSVSALPVKGI